MRWLLVAAALLAADSALAQRHTVAVQGGPAFFTTVGPNGQQVAVVAERDLGRGLRLEVAGRYFGRDERSTEGLLDFTWGQRTHVQAGASLVALYSYRDVTGLVHRLGGSVGVQARHAVEHWQQALVFVLEDPVLGPERLAADRRREGAMPVIVDVGDPRGRYVATTLRAEDTRPGVRAGLRYEVEIRRVIVGLEAAYVRYGQPRVGLEAHTADVALRAGYRF